MLKLQFLNTTHNLQTKFHIENIGPFHLFNFLAEYKVRTSTGDNSWYVTYIGDVLNLITWLYLKKGSSPDIKR